ncbi:MAG: hypothetical protein WC783_00565 [Candidatus Paceibacterota bacterium]|jgi:hypothetical protein
MYYKTATKDEIEAQLYYGMDDIKLNELIKLAGDMTKEEFVDIISNLTLNKLRVDTKR